MSKTIKLVIDETDEEVLLSGIPSEAWERFKQAAKKQFPKAGEDAWASFISEVIVAGSGGDTESVTYFMTGVPLENATALHNLLSQIGLTWDQFHYLLLSSAVVKDNFRLVNFKGEHNGVFIATGLSKNTFDKIEKATGTSFEVVMGTLFVAADNGTITFSPDTTYVKPSSA